MSERHACDRLRSGAVDLLRARDASRLTSGPRFTDRITEAEEAVADPDLSPELADADRVFLSARLGSLRKAIEDRGAVEQLLHGEPWSGNVLSTKNGPLFIDLETCCRGPVKFDLAHAPEGVCEHYLGVDQGLLDSAGNSSWRCSLRGAGWPTCDAVVRRLGGL